ncbi:MAG: aldehyde dehydrogenase family protein, partial [Thermoanaerobaculia bacterium]
MAIQLQRSGGNTVERSPSLHSMARARRAQRQWAEVGVAQRLDVIQRFRWALAERGSELARTVELTRSGGLAETLSAEILPLADACRFLEKQATALLGPRKPSGRGRPLWLFGTSSEVQREPLGVVLIIAASNDPLQRPGVQTIQALVAGNAVLLKPGRSCSKAAKALVDLLIDCGLPKDLVALLDESPAAAQWAMDAGVDKVLLTGSLATGREVLARLVPNVTPAIVELSGCDAVFVLPNADLNLVARALTFGLRLNGGATCIAPRRVFVPKSRLYALQQHLAGA